MRRRSLALLVLAGWLLVWSPSPGRTQEQVELLAPGPDRERQISAEEAHAYRVETEGGPVVVIVEQQGIDLIVEASGLEGSLAASAPNGRWGRRSCSCPPGP